MMANTLMILLVDFKGEGSDFLQCWVTAGRLHLDPLKMPFPS